MFWKTGYNAMTSLDLGTSFSTAKATNLEYMFQECGYKAMIAPLLLLFTDHASIELSPFSDTSQYALL